MKTPINNKKHNGYPLILIVFVIVVGGIFYFIKLKNDSPITTQPDKLNQGFQITPKTEKRADERDCIAGEQKITFSESFFVNKWFENFSASGEWGLLNPDKTVSLNWARDYAGPNDTRPTSKTAEWSSVDSSIKLKNTTLSNLTLTNFRFFSYKNALFAVPKEYDGIVFGPSKTAIEDFFKNQISPMWENSTGCNK